jgi:hypothetical protein
MPKFVGGCKNGEDASGFSRPRVRSYYIGGYDVAIRCETYEKRDDGNYHIVESKWARNMIREAKINV